MSSQLQKAARSLGASDSHYERQVGKELNAAFVSLDKVRAEGLVVAAKSFFDNHWDRIAALSSQYSIVAITGSAQGESFDSLGVFVWLHKPALLKAIDGLIDSEADDGHALSLSEREVRLAEIARDRLMIERQECVLVWSAQSAGGDAIEFRNDANVCAVLNIELRTLAS